MSYNWKISLKSVGGREEGGVVNAYEWIFLYDHGMHPHLIGCTLYIITERQLWVEFVRAQNSKRTLRRTLGQLEGKVCQNRCLATPQFLILGVVDERKHVSAHAIFGLEISLKYDFSGLKVRICDDLCTKLVEVQSYVYS